MNRTITTLFCLLLISFPAGAQQRDLKPGINYTTLGRHKPAAKPAAEALPAENTADAAVETDKDKDQKKEENPAVTVWNKYKALATGQTEEQKEAEGKGPKKPDAPEKPLVEKPAAPSPDHDSAVEKQQSGFANILDQWQSSKDSQREMRSKSFKVPKAAPAKPPAPAEDPS